MDKQFGNSRNPFDSLNALEIACVNDERLDKLFEEFELTEKDSFDNLLMQHCKHWLESNGLNLEDSEKERNCMRGKIREAMFVKESKEWNLGDIRFEMNWSSIYDHDMFLVSDKYDWTPVDYKLQSNTLHPRNKNDFNINLDTFCTIKANQIPKMCEENMPLILIDRHVDYAQSNNQRAKGFAERFPWTDKPLKMESERRLVFVETKKLCKMYTSKQNCILLKIPEGKINYDRDGSKFDGTTCCFSWEIFGNIPITKQTGD